VHRIFLAGVIALAVAAGPAASAPLQAMLSIRIEKVSPRGGDLRVAVYTEQSWADDNSDPAAGAVVAAKPGETVVTLGPLKPGLYGVKLFQDFNRNGHFDLNWIGWPLEKYGFSNDAIPTIGEPSFDAAKFELHPGANAIVVHLR
jgi:uncharacterized protein (DUF2141 family)